MKATLTFGPCFDLWNLLKNSKGEQEGFILRVMRCRALGDMEPVLVTADWKISFTSMLSLPATRTHSLTCEIGKDKREW